MDHKLKKTGDIVDVQKLQDKKFEETECQPLELRDHGG